MPIPIPSRVVYDACVALNFSGTKELLKSPAHYQAYLNTQREETKALRVGKYVHALVLEPDVAVSNFAVIPEGIDRRTKDGKAAYSEFESGAVGKTILTLEEATTSERVSRTMLSIKNRLGVSFEFTEFMFTTIINGVPVKCAVDAVGSDGYLYDLKTSEDASPRGFLKSIYAYRYDLQAHIYRSTLEAAFSKRLRGFRFIVAEKDVDAGAVYEIGPDLQTRAICDWENALKTYKQCEETGIWPGYSEEIQVIDSNKPASAAPAPIQFA
jgi:exodeoxyribonuclease VIII